MLQFMHICNYLPKHLSAILNSDAILIAHIYYSQVRHANGFINILFYTSCISFAPMRNRVGAQNRIDCINKVL